ncbi:MAG: hypothetical protein BEN18_08520 [Epulopiscium sp. Nuni2H_MBin001]|nr:MAG: hypothetical protein BEN18_08520 [Epulopiscium sp. Nuni2H_MBin001]
MTRYIYTATKIVTNEKVKGEIESFSMEEAKQQLLAKNILVQNIRKKTILDKEVKAVSTSVISKEELIFLLQELLAVLQSGISLYDALVLIKSSSYSRATTKLVNKLIAYVVKGSTLSHALEETGGVPSFVIGAIKAGECTGKLEQTLEIIIKQLELEIQSTKKLKKAMVYPGIVLTTIIIAGMIAINFIFPQLIYTFEYQNAKLPTITLIFIFISTLLQTHTIPMIIAIFGTIVSLMVISSIPAGKVMIEFIKLKIYKYNRLYILYRNKEIANLLGVLLVSGVALPEAVELLKSSTESYMLKNILDITKQNISEGKYLSYSLNNCKLISPYLVGVIEIGENTGQLGTILLRTGEYFEKSYQHQIEKALVWVEPMVTLLLSLIVAFVVIAMMLPMLTLSLSI